jgi:uncharacterized membrane protein YdjX (TVP38/TMEM64 family)
MASLCRGFVALILKPSDGLDTLSDLPASSLVTMPADDRRKAARVPGEGRSAARRFAPLLLIVVLIATAYALGVHRDVSFETLIRHRAAINHFIDRHLAMAVTCYVALYIVVVSLSLPGVVILTVTGGFLFGTVLGSVAAMFGATVGAAVIFLVARSAAGESLARRAGPYAARFAEGFRANAFNYMLFLRLVPFPFWLVNLLPALFNVRLSTFVTATALGILPGTVAFAMFGAGLGGAMAADETAYQACVAAEGTDCHVDFDLSRALTPTMFAAMAALGFLALVPTGVRWLWGRRSDTEAVSRRR